MYRNETKEIRIGNVKIGGDNPVAIQSMTNTKTEDVRATTEQILRLLSSLGQEEQLTAELLQLQSPGNGISKSPGGQTSLTSTL